MNESIRRVGIGILVLFLAVVGQLTYLQLVRAEDLENDPRNVRVFIKDLNRPRGSIVSADGLVLAESVPSVDDGDDFDLQRVYPPETAELFAHIVGYQSVNFGNIGVEAEYNGDLVGRRLPTRASDLADLLTGEDLRGNVVLTVSARAQLTAAALLAGRQGTVVVLDTATGAIVAAYSNPTYNPNFLASHDVDIASVAFQLVNAGEKQALQRAWRETYPPGSTFKVATTAMGLEAGVMTPTEPVYPSISQLDLPLTNNTLSNFGGSQCGGDLIASFRQSCNTTFGQIGLDLGDRFTERLPQFGINTTAPPTDLRPGVVRSTALQQVESFQRDAPLFAQAAIGQQVFVTPLEMAMIAQSVANGGEMMVPHVLDHVQTAQGEIISESRFQPARYKTAMRPDTAATVRDLMVEVVNNGTGRRAQIPGIQVAGKTGTAQVEGADAHAWFIAFAPAEAPRYAVSVLVENGGDLGSEATGGQVAAPIAAEMLKVLLAP